MVRRPVAPGDDVFDFNSRFALSLADAFAATLASQQKADLVTGDPEFKAVAKEIKVHWIK